MGPTAAGKTDAAMILQDQFAGHIVSVDSALVYRGMDIGTAKPTQQELQKYPHELVDICDPWDAYSAANFCEDAYKCMEKARNEAKVPILAGGTMMYYRSLQQGLSNMPNADPEIRQQILQEGQEQGWDLLHQRLAKIDPDSAKRINKNDPQRIQRALEVYAITGQTMTELHRADEGEKLDYQTLKLVIAPERAVLHQRIEKRFKIMLEQGFIEEVESLKANPKIQLEMPSMRSVGYRQVWQHLDGKLDKEEMVYRGIVATRQLAKRQWTWLRKEQNCIWLDPTNQGYLNQIEQLTEEFLQS